MRTGWIGRGHGGCSPPARATAKDANDDECCVEDRLWLGGRERECVPRIEKDLVGQRSDEARKGEVSMHHAKNRRRASAAAVPSSQTCIALPALHF